MSARPCPTDVEMSRAVTVGLDIGLAMHIASCAPCRDAWEGFMAAIEQARELPADIPSAVHREDVRTRLLARSELRPAHRRKVRLVVPALVLAAAAAAAVAIHLVQPTAVGAPPQLVARGVVHPHVGARYALSAPPDEIVQLRDGTIDIHVDPLGPGERFRVAVGQDEVEVRGTAFDVVAASDRLIAVHVMHGRVEVRRVGEPAIVLVAGEGWNAPVATVPVEPAPTVPTVVIAAPRARPVHQPTSRPPPAPATSADELAFVGAWNAMRRNDFSHAAATFAEVSVLSPDGPLTEDASYWCAVATARIPQAANAIAAFREFLDHFPRSPRAPEASAMLGWLLLDAGEHAEAKRRFGVAIMDRNEGVRASARAGLDEAARR